ncbi:MAG: DUF3488 and transglutaminase-like domain-containing protein [Pyrinomonadaceae bacterium]|nr:DUF3488 and transglutaminase-like domain-containing protein [Pyrinomonadaceae bacterium]
MNLERFFSLISYSVVLCGFLSLWVSGTFGIVSTALFLIVVAAAWLIENSKWQISERVGTVLIVLAMPAFYLGWRFGIFAFSGSETAIAGILARMILSLTAIKLLQRKGGRDWIFLYLMAFFEVLLAAGLSISAVYLASFVLFLLVTVCAIIAFEIRKTSNAVQGTKEGVASDVISKPGSISVNKLPATAITLIVFTIVLALPLFFVLPRVGSAGLGGGQSSIATNSGFSDVVKLGGIGKIQQSDAVVMRVRSDGQVRSPAGGMYLRGVALDTFSNSSWSKSRRFTSEPYVRGDRDVIQFDYATGRDTLTAQTIYLEPLDSPVLFGMPRIVAVQGNFPLLNRDGYGSISFQRSEDRVSYRVFSDVSIPSGDLLRTDNGAYRPEDSNYLQLPADLDGRISSLAASVTAGKVSRYDKAVAIESYLQTSFGYTLEQKAGGDQPLSDFLFNVKEGHCEYFATAMAVMLRTQGIASRVVNGFSGGEYNDAANVTIVRQRNAHAWVEAYFPKEAAWITFDPTPFAGQQQAGSLTGIMGGMSKYFEALEMFWIQYFVAYDNQEQASIARSVRRGFSDYQSTIADSFTHFQQMIADWWAEVRGDHGATSSIAAIGSAFAYVFGTAVMLAIFVWLSRRVIRLKLWARLRRRLSNQQERSIVDFYEKMLEILAAQGQIRLPCQTPLEFAKATGSNEVKIITEEYHKVRYGSGDLKKAQSAKIEELLIHLAARS